MHKALLLIPLSVICLLSLAHANSEELLSQHDRKPQSGKASLTYEDNGGTIKFGNSLVELSLVSETGYIKEITNKVSGRQYKLEGEGCWPFGMELGLPNVPKLLSIEVADNAPFPQAMHHEVAPVAGGKVLKLNYGNLRSTGGTFTGIQMLISITLKDDADYFLINFDIDNKSKYYVNKLYSGLGGLVAADSRAEETLVVPGWDYGKLYGNPHDFFAEPETYGYPIFGSSCALVAGWLDLQGPDGGIGIGYVNRRGLTMQFNVQRDKQALNMNWQLFNFSDLGPWGAVEGVFGLEPGKSFSTDEWIVAPHRGDWHRMADIYREEYAKAFQGTYLNASNTNPIAKEIDFVFSTVIYAETNGTVDKRFEQIPGFVKTMAQTLKTEPKHLLLTLLGHDVHWPLHMPDMYPANSKAGGNEEFKKMIANLSDMEMHALLVYGHTYYNHPKSRRYVAEADTGFDASNRYWREIGNIACMDSAAWQDMWKRELIPPIAELGAAGVYWDQGATQYLVCPLPNHRHGPDSIEQLKGHTRGTLDLQQNFHDVYRTENKKPPIFWTEVGSDLTGRTMDIWTTTPGEYARGGTLKREIVRYAVPYHLCANVGPASAYDVNMTFVNGFICWPNLTAPEDVMAAQQQFAKLRQELREANAPGFPHGFKDTVGLTANDPDLIVRAYRDKEGISVLYFANEPLESSVTVNASELGFAGEETTTFTVKLEKNQAGFKTIQFNR